MMRPKVLISQKIFDEAVAVVKEDFEVQEKQTDTPLPADELIQMKNVVLAPHIASASYETRLQMATMATKNLVAGLTEKRPPNLVNPEVFQ